MNAVNNLAVHENRREFRRLFIGCRNGRRRPRNTVNLTTPLAGLEQAAGHQGQRINHDYWSGFVFCSCNRVRAE